MYSSTLYFVEFESNDAIFSMLFDEYSFRRYCTRLAKDSLSEQLLSCIIMNSSKEIFNLSKILISLIQDI